MNENGFSILQNVLSEETIADLVSQTDELSHFLSKEEKNSSTYGIRDLLNLSPAIRAFSKSQTVLKIARSILGKDARVVRAIFFNKTAEANWKVPWHQDLTIAVKERIDREDFSAWTRKANIWHVQPPISILEDMITLRFHLDDADKDTGALRIIANSHSNGRLNAEMIKDIRMANETVVCRVKSGDCLVIRPLLLHSSSACVNPRQRRVIHFEFSAQELPDPMEWHES